MSTNIEIDRKLLARARAALGGGASIKDTVEEGLRRIVAERSLIELSGLVGKMMQDPRQRELMLNLRDRAWRSTSRP